MSANQLLALKLHLHAHPKLEAEQSFDFNRYDMKEPLCLVQVSDNAQDVATDEVQKFLSEVLSQHWPFWIDFNDTETHELYGTRDNATWDIQFDRLGLQGKWFSAAWNCHKGGMVMAFEKEGDMFRVLDHVKS